MVVALVGACSDGGGGRPLSGPPPGGGTGGGGGGGGSSSPAPVWTPGVYDPASTFAQRCENPRSGFDIEGNAFPDRPGSLLEEKFWLRSWTNETYLWNDEVPDINPDNGDSRTEYFQRLKTPAIEPSGAPRDDFHFSQPTEEFLAERNSAGTAGYGFSLQVESSVPPRDFRVRYVDPGTPAAEAPGGVQNFRRGTRILTVDGVDLVNADTDAEIDILNAGLFPATAGETHVFGVRDADSSTIRTVTVVSADVSRDPVLITDVIDTASGPVGYILFNTFSPFSSEPEIVEAIEQLRDAAVTDLILDLRYNGGGLLAVASQLSYMIAGPAFTDGKIFETLRFNDDAGDRNPVTGQLNDPIPFFATSLGFTDALPSGQPLPTLDDVTRVFILSTGTTCSASEAVINALTGVDFEVVLIGDITCGKPYGFYPTDNCGETYYTIQFQGVNDKGFGDYADGFVPDNNPFAFGVRLDGCTVADDLGTSLGGNDDPLVSAALAFRETGVCPAPALASAQSAGSSLKDRVDERLVIDVPTSVIATNRDMTLPDNRR